MACAVRVCHAGSGAATATSPWPRPGAKPPDTGVVASGGINVPSINTREISTQVLVNDGQTVVLGGILETTHRTDETKVPFLGDVPVLGNLFKTSTKTNDKDELLIFVTPKIIREGVNVY